MSQVGAESPDFLVGRRTERGALAELIDAVRAGQGGALVIEGAPGVGKSALVAATLPDDVDVLRARGAESEIDLPFVGLADLLHPIRGRIDLLPGPLAVALQAALGTLATPQPVENAAVLRAVVALLERVALDRPLIAVVDDVQWLDLASRDAVAFVVRRAHLIGVGVIAIRSVRGAEPSPWTDVPRMELADLPDDDALVLARRADIADDVARRLVERVGGNPLAITTVTDRLTGDQRRGRVPLPDALPIGDRLLGAFDETVAGISAAGRRALLVMAAGRTDDRATIEAAVADPAALAEVAGHGGLIIDEGVRIRFVHPLVRSGIFGSTSATMHRDAHLRMAAATTTPERAWHLAMAATQPDESVALELEALASDAAHRGAPMAAAATLVQAAAVSPPGGALVRRTMDAAAAALVGGHAAYALRLLDGLSAAMDDDPGTRAHVQMLRGTAIGQVGDPTEAEELLRSEAERIAPVDRALAAQLMTLAGITLTAHGPVSRMLQHAEQALELAGADALFPSVLKAEALATLGECDAARAILNARADELFALDPTAPGHDVISMAALCHLWLEDFEDAERLVHRTITACRARGAVAPLVGPLMVLASLHTRRGSLARADQLIAEAIALGEGSVSGFMYALVLALGAAVDAQIGEATRCHTRASQAIRMAHELRLTSVHALAEHALGLLALGEGNYAAAVDHLTRSEEHTERFGARDPSFLLTLGDLAEAHARRGDRDAVRAIADRLDADAAGTGGAWAAAAAARCRALVAPNDELDGLLARALDAHRRLGSDFHEARTRFVVGTRLRRARRSKDAIEQLTRALDGFRATGAHAWVARAETELGPTPPQQPGRAKLGAADAEALDASCLTDRELAVCRLVADGLTNAETAMRLFISARTVEHHLRSAYRKLSIRSRSELARRFRV